MLIVNKTEKDIAGAINGVAFSIPYKEVIYNELQDIVNKLKTVKDSSKAKELELRASELTTLNFNEVVATANPFLSYNPVTKYFYLTKNKGKKEAVIDYRPIPQLIVNKITESFELGLDYMPLVKTWARFLHREWFKEFTTEDSEFLSYFLTTNYFDRAKCQELIDEEGLEYNAAMERIIFPDIAITEEGLLALYKVVEEVKEKWIIVKDEDNNPVLNSDGTPKKMKVRMAQWKNTHEVDELTGEITTEENKPGFVEDRVFTPAIWKNGQKFFSGNKYSYMYKVGETQRLPRTHEIGGDAIINTENTFGGGGLYVGGLTYIDKYRSKDSIVLVCFVDPANIISFQDEGHAFRVWELFPYGILEDDTELKGFYHSSKYAKESAERTKSYIEEVVREKKGDIEEAARILQDKQNINEELRNI